MASLYLPGTIDTPRKEIARYEGGYIRNCFGVLIGRYDNKFVYDGTNNLNTNFIGSIEFNYGYFRSSKEIFVTSHSDGSLSMGNNKYVAYFDGEEKGAIAAFILCYAKGLIELYDEKYSDNNNINREIPHENMFISLGGGAPESEQTGENTGGGYLLGLIGVIFFLVCCVISGFATWGNLISDTATGEATFSDAWMSILPIIGIGIAEYILFKNKKQTFGEILAVYCSIFLIIIILGGIIVAIYTKNIIFVLVGALGMFVLCIPPFILGCLGSYIIMKLRHH